MAVASLPDLDVFYELQGEGAPVVLVSGLAGVASYWEPNVSALASGNRVLRYDHRGTGRTTRTESRYSIELLAEDLVALLDHLGIERASIVGHSTGGAIGQVLAARYPERVDRLVLYATWATLCPQMRMCMEFRQTLLMSDGPPAFHRSSPIFLYPPRYVCETWPTIERELDRNIRNSTSQSIIRSRIEAVVGFDGTPYLGAIEAPTLVLVAEDDILTPPVASEELAASIRNARLTKLAYGGHAVSYCEPDAFNAAVSAFLNG